MNEPKEMKRHTTPNRSDADWIRFDWGPKDRRRIYRKKKLERKTSEFRIMED